MRPITFSFCKQMSTNQKHKYGDILVFLKIFLFDIFLELRVDCILVFPCYCLAKKEGFCNNVRWQRWVVEVPKFEMMEF